MSKDIKLDFNDLGKCFYYVHKNGEMIRYIPEEFKTKYLCKTALKTFGEGLYYVPEHLIDKEMCELAVQQDGYALKYVPKDFLTEDICKQAIYSGSIAIKFVPNNFITYKMCYDAVMVCADALYYVPKDFFNKELCSIASYINYKVSCEIPTEWQDEIFSKQNQYDTSKKIEIFWKERIKKDAKEFENYMMHGIETPNMCIFAVQQDINNLQYVPAHMKDYVLCEIKEKEEELEL